VFDIVSLSVLDSVINHDERRHEVDEFTRWQHTKVRPRIATSVPVAVRVQNSLVKELSDFHQSLQSAHAGKERYKLMGEFVSFISHHILSDVISSELSAL